jgi:integrase
VKRPYASGQVYEKWGADYGRRRTADGQRLNRRIGPKRASGSAERLTRAQAEKAFRKLQRLEDERMPIRRTPARPTVDQAVLARRERLELEGARLAYRQNCESMHRVHISPALGKRRVESIEPEDVERLARAMLGRGLAPKTVRNVVTFLHSAFTLAVENGWCAQNPVVRSARPRRRRDANPDLRFLTVPQLDAVLAAIPDETVRREAARERPRPGAPHPPVPADVLGPVLRVLILAAAFTGLRQSELIGLRWRDVDLDARRIRVRNAYVRGEHSGEGKSDLSTRRSVPMTERLNDGLSQWRQQTVFRDVDDLVFAHPALGTPLDRTKVTRRFKRACDDAGVPVIRFHDLRHTFATHLAASGIPLRTIQEFSGTRI